MKLDPSIRLVVSLELEDHVLRAIAVEYPGSAPELWLQRVDLGDEATPYKVVRETRVVHNAINRIETANWTEGGLTFTEGKKTWFVRASSDAFETKAIKD